MSPSGKRAGRGHLYTFISAVTKAGYGCCSCPQRRGSRCRSLFLRGKTSKTAGMSSGIWHDCRQSVLVPASELSSFLFWHPSRPRSRRRCRHNTPMSCPASPPCAGLGACLHTLPPSIVPTSASLSMPTSTPAPASSLLFSITSKSSTRDITIYFNPSFGNMLNLRTGR